MSHTHKEDFHPRIAKIKSYTDELTSPLRSPYTVRQERSLQLQESLCRLDTEGERGQGDARAACLPCLAEVILPCQGHSHEFPVLPPKSTAGEAASSCLQVPPKLHSAVAYSNTCTVSTCVKLALHGVDKWLPSICRCRQAEHMHESQASLWPSSPADVENKVSQPQDARTSFHRQLRRLSFQQQDCRQQVRKATKHVQCHGTISKAYRC